jgi:3,4-dihydroxy 2-butanone 4-phosphate synthase/GTP cyclohydrolase II
VSPGPGTAARAGTVGTGAGAVAAADPVDAAARELAAGRPVLVDDDVAGAGGAVVVAAEHCDTRTMAFLVRATSGLVYVAMTGARLDELQIPPISAPRSGPDPSAVAVSVDLRTGISTGISARDRAGTVRALADPATRSGDLVRPGHVLPVRVRPGGVLERPRPAEAAVELCAMAGLHPAAALATAVDGAGELVDRAAFAALACEHGMALVRVSEIVAWRRRRESPVRPGAAVALPTVHGRFSAVGYSGDGGEHLALVRGDVPGASRATCSARCAAGAPPGSRRPSPPSTGRAGACSSTSVAATHPGSVSCTRCADARSATRRPPRSPPTSCVTSACDGRCCSPTTRARRRACRQAGSRSPDTSRCSRRAGRRR